VSDPASTVDPAAESNAPKQKNYFRAVAYCCGVGFVLWLFIGVALLPIRVVPDWVMPSAELQTTRTIGISMFQYAADHHGKYPDGKSSTEVFQKLINEQYVSDPTIFFIPLPGKTEPIEGQSLKPENVCFDVTSGVDASAPDGLPIVFITGYKVTYAPGGAAIPLVKTPQDVEVGTSGIAVCYKDNSAMFRLLETAANSAGTIPNFVSPMFDAQGKTYRQLTPDGRCRHSGQSLSLIPKVLRRAVKLGAKEIF
jgi:hypothetical protein